MLICHGKAKSRNGYFLDFFGDFLFSVYLQNIPSIFVYFSRGGAWYVESPAAGLRSFAGVGGSNGVNVVVRKLR